MPVLGLPIISTLSNISTPNIPKNQETSTPTRLNGKHTPCHIPDISPYGLY